MEKLNPVTSRDVARIAGVSQATVSRVLGGHPNVRPETREAVLRALAETKYQPNGLARAMKTNRTGTVGVVVARLSNPLYPAMLQVLGSALVNAGMRMIVWDAELGGEQSASEAVRQGIVDGLIFTTATRDSTALQEVIERGAPVVLMNRVVEGCACGQVASDNLSGGTRVAEYLVQCGRRRIGLISGPKKPSTIRLREEGFLAGLEAHGVEPARELYVAVESFSHKNGHEAMRRLLELASPPDAMFCANDVLAFGAMDSARSLGIRVPDELWVVGYDDVEMASWEAFDLTTVRQPLRDMSEIAVRRLLWRINGEGNPEFTLDCLPNELVIRGSTARTPVPRGTA